MSKGIPLVKKKKKLPEIKFTKRTNPKRPKVCVNQLLLNKKVIWVYETFSLQNPIYHKMTQQD